MRTLGLTTLLTLAICGCAADGTKPAVQGADEGAGGPRIGIYDSRSVAIAYAGSNVFGELNKKLHADYEAAKKSGDSVLKAELERQGKEGQKKLHMQGFSTAPVDDILKHIEARLPDIQKAANVEVLVSKWDDATLAKYPNAVRVDVTMALVDAFEPNANQRASAVDIQKHKPISLKEAALIDD
ncbi:MAG: hypothetical protein AMXMBFR84_05830 [Candidatus Hydrogenedentota bacterium]